MLNQRWRVAGLVLVVERIQFSGNGTIAPQNTMSIAAELHMKLTQHFMLYLRSGNPEHSVRFHNM